jgi:hypothetical protein
MKLGIAQGNLRTVYDIGAEEHPLAFSLISATLKCF